MQTMKVIEPVFVLPNWIITLISISGAYQFLHVYVGR